MRRRLTPAEIRRSVVGGPAPEPTTTRCSRYLEERQTSPGGICERCKRETGELPPGCPRHDDP